MVIYVGIQIKEVRTMKFTFNKWPYNPDKPTVVDVTLELSNDKEMLMVKINGSQILTIHNSGGAIITTESCLLPLIASIRNETLESQEIRELSKG
jgi:agmatine/peptidylarginine deiminase